MILKFTKMHGLGNDFVVLDLVSQPFNLRGHHVRKLANRHTGIGCDQLLVVEAPQNPDMDFRYRVYNADGREVEQCGNGARCLAKFVQDKKLTRKHIIQFETTTGNIALKVREGCQVEVNMGVPELSPAKIPFRDEAVASRYVLQINGEDYSIGAVSMGNPHAVLEVAAIESAPVETLGPLIEAHSDFPQRVNAGFMQILSRQEINLRVYERGVGETLACGTGACAAVVSGRISGLLDEAVTVNLTGGALQILWAGEDQPVIMAGPATTVFEGTVRL